MLRVNYKITYGEIKVRQASDNKLYTNKIHPANALCAFIYHYKAEDGREIDIYKESTCMGMIAPRGFSFREYNQGIPQKIAENLNNGLKKCGVYTDFIERSHDNV